MAKQKYVPIFLDWTETTQDLTQGQKGNLIDAIVDYAAVNRSYEEIVGGMDAIERVAFRFLKGQVDRNLEISAVRSEARINKTNQNATNDNKTEQKITNVTKSLNNNKNKNKEENKNNITELFDRFWKAYPRHEAKANALKAFEKLKPTEDLLQTMLRAIEKQKSTAQWQENGGQFIPHPATWLNQRRWEDEPVKGQTGKTVAAQQYTQRDYSNEDEEARQWMIDAIKAEKAKEEEMALK